VKLKDVFLGVLIVALIASEAFLFSANQQKHRALDDLKQAQHDVQQAQAELQQVKDADAAAQTSLRAENQSLTRRLTDAQSVVNKLRADNQQLNQQLGTAREAVQLQQQHLEQLQTESDQTVAVGQTACLNNLRQIESAKTAWALENNKAVGDIPTADDLLVYLPGGVFPVCPSGGTYTVGAVGAPTSCSVHGTLPTQ
jgi:DNA repair exonuclease SbcCD ATPase subunit